MTDKEIAMQITVKAIDARMVKITKADTMSESNEKNADEVAKFFSKIYKTVHDFEDTISVAAQ